MWRMGIWRVRSPMSSRAQTVRSGAGGNLSRTRACGLTAKLFIGDSRNFDVEVNAVQQGAADFGEIALDDAGRAAAFAGGIAVETTGTWVHGGHQHDARGKCESAIAAREIDGPFFERLTKLFQHAAWEFGQLIHEQNALMRETDFAWPRTAAAAADQTGVGDRMVRCTEGALA